MTYIVYNAYIYIKDFNISIWAMNDSTLTKPWENFSNLFLIP